MDSSPSKQEEKLWEAALNDDGEAIKVSEADINSKTPLGNTALHIAASGGCLNAVRALLNRGADVDCLDNNGLTPLFKAVKGGKAEIAHHLIDRGAATSVQDSEETKLIHYAALNGLTNLVQVLLERDRECVLARDESGWLPIHMACKGGHLKIVRLLLTFEMGSHVDHVNEECMLTSLHEAAFWGRKSVVRFLLDSQASINARNKINETPLYLAKRLGHTYVSELIRSRGGVLEEVIPNQ